MVKCIFGASVTGANLSLSRSLVNQVKGIYCLGSQLTSWVLRPADHHFRLLAKLSFYLVKL